jgi:predicted RNase H-like HicB family nuclease
MIGQFTAVYEKRGKWYIGFVEEITGVNTQGRTLSEVKKNLHEALRMIIEVNRSIAHKSHHKNAIEEPISIAVE